MDIMELGALGELVGGVAVIASLLFVGFQVRQANTHTVQSLAMERSQANRETSRHWTDIVSAARDADFMEIFQKATVDFEDLSHVDKGRIALWFGAFQVHGVSVFLAGRAGMMDETYVDAWLDNFASYVKTPGLRPVWEHAKRYYYNDFVTDIDRRLSSDRALASIIEAYPWLGPAIGTPEA